MGTPDKDYKEVLPVRFDFTEALEGETITSKEVTCEVASGVGDSRPQDFLKDDSILVGGVKVDQWIKGGQINTKYLIRCKVITSSGRTLVGSARIPVIKR